MRGEDIPKTPFHTRYGNYEFFVMSFSLTNIVAAFMDLTNRLLQNNLDSFDTVFIDYMVVYFQNEDDHMGHLRVVLQTLKEHQLYAKYTSVNFC